MNLSSLRETRVRKGLTLQKVATRMGVSAPQVQRLETGERRMTVDLLESYCMAVGINPVDVLVGETRVPIIGIMETRSNILPVPAGSATSTRAPNIVPHPERLAAVRWEPREKFSEMSGHLLFFYADVRGLPEDVWGRRCIVRRTDGTQRVGWLFRKGGQAHINDLAGEVEFDVQVEWASPILAVVAPQVLAD
ncbi:MAG: helix-turn-helix domain-containing protein [Sphingomonadales bacterium]